MGLSGANGPRQLVSLCGQEEDPSIAVNANHGLSVMQRLSDRDNDGSFVILGRDELDVRIYSACQSSGGITQCLSWAHHDRGFGRSLRRVDAHPWKDSNGQVNHGEE
jgi:hypothetical protein